MRDWSMQSRQGANVALRGETLPEAVSDNFAAVARDLGLGNAAGYRLERVTLQYEPGILGGQGGIVVTILHRGLPLLDSTEMGQRELSTAWINAAREDCPEPVEIEIKP